MATMKRICTWCQQYLGEIEIDNIEDIISYSICKHCYIDKLGEMIKRLGIKVYELKKQNKKLAAQRFEKILNEHRNKLDDYLKASNNLKPVALMRLTEIKDPDELLEKYNHNNIIIEEKLDGWKAQVIKSNNKVHIYSRRGEEKTENFPELVNSLKFLPNNTLVEGELVYWNDSKQDITKVISIAGSNPEKAIKKAKELPGQIKIHFYDILWNDGKNVTDELFDERRKILEGIIKESEKIQITRQYPFSKWQDVMNKAIKSGGEGIVLKLKNKSYKYKPKGESEPKPTDVMFKYKGGIGKSDSDDYVIYDTEVTDKGKLKAFFGQYYKGKLYHISEISNFSKENENKIKEKLKKDNFVIEIGFQERVPGGLRHQKFIRFRDDKNPKDATMNEFHVKHIDNFNIIKKASYLSEVEKALEEEVGKLPEKILYNLPEFDIKSLYKILSYLESGNKAWAIGDAGTSFGPTQVHGPYFMMNLARDPNIYNITGISSEQLKQMSSNWKKFLQILRNNYKDLWVEMPVDQRMVESFMQQNPGKILKRLEGTTVRYSDDMIIKKYGNNYVGLKINEPLLRNLGLDTSNSQIKEGLRRIMRHYITNNVVRNSIAQLFLIQSNPVVFNKFRNQFNTRNIKKNDDVRNLIIRVSQQDFMNKINSVINNIKKSGYDVNALNAFNFYQLIFIANSSGAGRVAQFLLYKKPFSAGNLHYIQSSRFINAMKHLAQSSESGIRQIASKLLTGLPSQQGFGGFRASVASYNNQLVSEASQHGILYFPGQYADDIANGKRRMTIRAVDMPIYPNEIIQAFTYSGSPICDLRILSKNFMSLTRILKAFGKHIAHSLEHKFGPDRRFVVIRFEPFMIQEAKDENSKWSEILIDKNGIKLTRKQIKDHYSKPAIQNQIMERIKGNPVLIYLGVDKNNIILKRNHNGKSIILTKADPNDKDNPNDYFYWVDRRMTSIHQVFGTKTNIGFVDLDIHGNYPSEKAKKYAKEVSKNIKNKFNVNSIIYQSGGTGFHIEFKLSKEKPINQLRKELKGMLDKINEKWEDVTTGIVKGSGMRTDVSTLHNKGSIRVPGSLGETYGKIKKPISENKVNDNYGKYLLPERSFEESGTIVPMPSKAVVPTNGLGSYFVLSKRDSFIKMAAHSGAMVALMAPDNIIKKLKNFTSNSISEDGLHMTFLYLGKAKDLNQTTINAICKVIENVCTKHQPLSMKISGIGKFTSGDDGIPVYVTPNAKGLNLLQADLENAISNLIDLPSEHGWVPHMTIGYYKDSNEIPEFPELPKIEWKADTVRLQVGGKNIADIPIGRRKKSSSTELIRTSSKNITFLLSKRHFVKDTDLKLYKIREQKFASIKNRKKKILMLVSPKEFYELEYFIPRRVFTEKYNFEVCVVSEGKNAIGSQGTNIVTIPISEVNINNYNSFFVVGGKGMIEFSKNNEAQKLLKEFIHQKKPIAMICHGPLLAAEIGILKGKKVTGWPDIVGKIRRAKGIWTGMPIERDGLLFTAIGPSDAENFAFVLSNFLNGNNTLGPAKDKWLDWKKAQQRLQRIWKIGIDLSEEEELARLIKEQQEEGSEESIKTIEEEISHTLGLPTKEKEKEFEFGEEDQPYEGDYGEFVTPKLEKQTQKEELLLKKREDIKRELEEMFGREEEELPKEPKELSKELKELSREPEIPKEIPKIEFPEEKYIYWDVEEDEEDVFPPPEFIMGLSEEKATKYINFEVEEEDEDVEEKEKTQREKDLEDLFGPEIDDEDIIEKENMDLKEQKVREKAKTIFGIKLEPLQDKSGNIISTWPILDEIKIPEMSEEAQILFSRDTISNMRKFSEILDDPNMDAWKILHNEPHILQTWILPALINNIGKRWFDIQKIRVAGKFRGVGNTPFSMFDRFDAEVLKNNPDMKIDDLTKAKRYIQEINKLVTQFANVYFSEGYSGKPIGSWIRIALNREMKKIIASDNDYKEIKYPICAVCKKEEPKSAVLQRMIEVPIGKKKLWKCPQCAQKVYNLETNEIFLVDNNINSTSEKLKEIKGRIPQLEVNIEDAETIEQKQKAKERLKNAQDEINTIQQVIIDLQQKKEQFVIEKKKYEAQLQVPRLHTICPNIDCPGQKVPLTAIDWNNEIWDDKVRASEFLEKLYRRFRIVPPEWKKFSYIKNDADDKQTDPRFNPPEWLKLIPFKCPHDGVEFTLQKALDIARKNKDERNGVGFLSEPYLRLEWISKIEHVREEAEQGENPDVEEMMVYQQLSDIARNIFLKKYWDQYKKIEEIKKNYGTRWEKVKNKPYITKLFQNMMLFDTVRQFSSVNPKAYVGWLAGREFVRRFSKEDDILAKWPEIRNTTVTKREDIYLPILHKWIDNMLYSQGPNWKDGFNSFGLSSWLTSEVDDIPSNGPGTFFISQIKDSIIDPEKVEDNVHPYGFNFNFIPAKTRGGRGRGSSKYARLLRILGMWKIDKSEVSNINIAIDKLPNVKERKGKRESVPVSIANKIIQGKTNLVTDILEHDYNRVSLDRDKTDLLPEDYILVQALVMPGQYNWIPINTITKMREDVDDERIFASFGDLAIRNNDDREFWRGFNKVIKGIKERLGDDKKLTKLKIQEFINGLSKKAYFKLSIRAAKDPLSTYRKKRKFYNTSEPIGNIKSKKNKYRFVIQKHKTEKANYHYDLRLENDKGTMSSWAIPKYKLPSEKEKLLAIKTEDHPISYNKFEGCFVYNTEITTDIGRIFIKEICNKIKKGEEIKVLSYNFNTNKMEWKKVLHYFIVDSTNEFINIKFDDSFIIVTINHLIYTKDGIKMAGDLTIDDMVYTYKDDKLIFKNIISIKPYLDSILKCYDLHIEDNHNYFAGKILVSNSIPKGEYGAGKVGIYDSGTYDEIEKSNDKIIFELNGKKEKGSYTLYNIDGKKWLIMKHNNKLSKRAGQTYGDDSKLYSVDMLIELAIDNKSKSILLKDLMPNLRSLVWGKKNKSWSIQDVLNNPRNKDFEDDVKAIRKVDLKYPILIYDGEIIDGYHRFAKAIMENRKKIDVKELTTKQMNAARIDKKTRGRLI